MARTWMTIAGIALLGAGLLGFVPNNPIASNDPGALFRTNAVHNVVHLITGALGLGIGLGLKGRDLANGTIGFGVLYAVVTLLLIVDPTMFGLLSDAPANAADHVLHAALAIVSIALGYMARDRVTDRDRSVAHSGRDTSNGTTRPPGSAAAFHVLRRR
jgi:hypothetical protein